MGALFSAPPPPPPPSGPPGALKFLRIQPRSGIENDGVLEFHASYDHDTGWPTHYRVQVYTVRGGKAAFKAAKKKVDEELLAMQAATPGPWVWPRPVYELDGPDPRLTRVLPADPRGSPLKYYGLASRTHYVFGVSPINDEGKGPERLSNASAPYGRRNFAAFRAQLAEVNRVHFGDSDGAAADGSGSGGGTGADDAISGEAAVTVDESGSDSDDSVSEERQLLSGSGVVRGRHPSVRFAEEVSVHILPPLSADRGDGDGYEPADGAVAKRMAGLGAWGGRLVGCLRNCLRPAPSAWPTASASASVAI